MAARKSTKSTESSEPEASAEGTESNEPEVVQSFPNAILPGSNFASRKNARMNTRG